MIWWQMAEDDIMQGFFVHWLFQEVCGSFQPQCGSVSKVLIFSASNRISAEYWHKEHTHPQYWKLE